MYSVLTHDNYVISKSLNCMCVWREKNKNNNTCDVTVTSRDENHCHSPACVSVSDSVSSEEDYKMEMLRHLRKLSDLGFFAIESGQPGTFRGKANAYKFLEWRPEL